MSALDDFTDETLFNRAGGKGDLFDSFKSIVEKGGSIPIDVYKIHYSEFPEQGHHHEVLKTNPIKTEDFECMLNEINVNKLGEAVEYLNKVYGMPSDNKLRFWLRTVYDIKKGDRLAPKFLCNDLRIDISSTTAGVYVTNGWIKLHPTALINNKEQTLAHDVGHGIFGFGHHEPRSCIMDLNSNGLIEPDYFCEEDRNTLYRLVNKQS